MRDRARYRFHAHSEPLPEPDESLLEERHREWLARHKRQREQHLHPVANKMRREERLRASKSDGLILPSLHKAVESDSVAATLVRQDISRESGTGGWRAKHIRPWLTQRMSF